MFLLEKSVAAALQTYSHFATGWHIREGYDNIERQTAPALNIRTTGAQPLSSAGAGVRIEASIAVALIVPRESLVTHTLDSAFAAAIACLHGLRLQDSSGRHWSALQLVQIRETALEGGLGGCELHFTSYARFAGKPCD